MKWHNLHLKEDLSLEEKLVHLLILVNYTLLFFWQMQLPIHEHCICVCNRRLSVFDRKLIKTEKTSNNAAEINEVGKAGKDRRLVFEIPGLVFRNSPRARDDLTNC